MSILSIILIAISLSMDTFSLALSIGTTLTRKKDVFILSFIVGIFHFFMPIIGSFFGNKLKIFFNINSNLLLFYLFLFIAVGMIIDLFNKNEKSFTLSFWHASLFSFSVSIDSFTIGIGLNEIIDNIIFSSFIFIVISSFFTYLGLKIGIYSFKKIGIISKIIGIIIILFLALKKL